MNILKQHSQKEFLSILKEKGEQKFKKVKKYIINGSAVIFTALTADQIDKNYRENIDYYVVKKLISIDSEKSKVAAVIKLKENPNLLDSFLPTDKYHVIQNLSNLILDKESNKLPELNKLEDKLIQENDYSLKLSSDNLARYFSAERISNPQYFSKLNLVYDKNNNALYNLNKNNNRLEKIIGGVKRVFEIENQIYFIQGDNLFKFEEKLIPNKNNFTKSESKQEIKLVEQCNLSPCYVWKIYGTNSPSYIFSGRENKIVLFNSNPDEKKELESFLNRVQNVSEVKSNMERLVFKNHALYLSYKKQVVKFEFIDKKPVMTYINSEYSHTEDYYIQDLNNDGLDDIVFFDCGKLYDSYEVSYKNSKGDYDFSHKIVGGKCSSENFDYTKTSQNWLNPTLFKEELKSELIKK